jgi:hypothetical protein
MVLTSFFCKCHGLDWHSLLAVRQVLDLFISVDLYFAERFWHGLCYNEDVCVLELKKGFF